VREAHAKSTFQTTFQTASKIAGALSDNFSPFASRETRRKWRNQAPNLEVSGRQMKQRIRIKRIIFLT
jgi:hypothetical protein